MKYITQKELARRLGYDSTKEIRDVARGMKLKGWPVLSDTNGMFRSESQPVIDRVAASLVKRAEMILATAQGLMRKEREPLSLEEEMLWLSLPEQIEEEKPIKTKFDYITEEDLR